MDLINASETVQQTIASCPVEHALETVLWIAGTIVAGFGVAFGIIARFLYARIKDVGEETRIALNAIRKDLEKDINDHKELCFERRQQCGRHMCGKITNLETRMNKLESTTADQLKSIGETMVKQGASLVKVAEHMRAVDERLVAIERKINHRPVGGRSPVSNGMEKQ